MCAALLARHRPVEESQIAAGRGFAVGIEQVIGGDVVLIDRLLHEAHAEQAGIESDIARRIGGDGGEMMDAGELHGVPPGVN